MFCIFCFNYLSLCFKAMDKLVRSFNEQGMTLLQLPSLASYTLQGLRIGNFSKWLKLGAILNVFQLELTPIELDQTLRSPTEVSGAHSKGGEPVRPGVAMTDLATGLYAYGAIMAALLQRQKTGKGMHVDCNLLSSQVRTYLIIWIIRIRFPFLLISVVCHAQ
ncbi:hypothetical protein JD844_002619 [Phrynosoma platyrhinos]|uniref:CoA-transferase family III n=1 Tax=Phrynosoma platyrhinos TaxID=52577 RepID=A0ABQ7TCD0_PHRPL|nr:hypothetical protein JD844_002619 [Phrynosoma platyrhinos]